MIREIFLPERIGTRRIIAQRIVGITLHDDAVYAVQINARRSDTVIESISTESFEPGNHESIVQALIRLKAKLGKHDRIVTTLPASVVVIKELEVPFIDHDKIRMVLDYEIESMLPFSIEEAIVDFIVTESSPGQASSFILAAAVRMQDLQNTLELYARAGIDPTTVTVDLFAFYSLYKQIAEYQAIKNGSALVDLGLYTTRISFLQNGKMRMTRQIPRGLMTMVNAITKESTDSPEEILNKIRSMGISNTHENNEEVAIQKQVVNFFNDIQFTLNSFSLKANYYEGITKILFTGKAVDINGFMKFSSNLLQIPCEIFDVKKFLTNKYIKNSIVKEPPHWSHYAAALGAAIPAPMFVDFNLRRKSFTPVHHQVMVRQIITAGILIVGIITMMGIIGFMQMSSLNQQVVMLEQQQIKRLSILFPEKERPKQPKLQALINNAKKVVKDKGELFRPIIQDKTHPLELLLELTELIIDKKKSNMAIVGVLIQEEPHGKMTIKVDGYFKSDGDKWHDWAEVKKRFKEAQFLELVEDISESVDAEKGIKFTAIFKLKESIDKEA